MTDGTDATLLEALRKAATSEGALVEFIAPWIGGVRTSDGTLIPAHQHVDGGPSVLYDAVAMLASAEGATALAADPAAKDFVTDAHAHGKFIAYDPAAVSLLGPRVSPVSSTMVTSHSSTTVRSPTSSNDPGR